MLELEIEGSNKEAMEDEAPGVLIGNVMAFG